LGSQAEGSYVVWLAGGGVWSDSETEWSDGRGVYVWPAGPLRLVLAQETCVDVGV